MKYVFHTKKEISEKIFNEELTLRANGKWSKSDRPYRDFRRCVRKRFVDEIGVTDNSATSMFNVNKDSTMVRDPSFALVRDPKIIRDTTPKRRGRPPKAK